MCGFDPPPIREVLAEDEDRPWEGLCLGIAIRKNAAASR